MRISVSQLVRLVEQCGNLRGLPWIKDGNVVSLPVDGFEFSVDMQQGKTSSRRAGVHEFRALCYLIHERNRKAYIVAPMETYVGIVGLREYWDIAGKVWSKISQERRNLWLADCGGAAFSGYEMSFEEAESGGVFYVDSRDGERIFKNRAYLVGDTDDLVSWSEYVAGHASCSLGGMRRQMDELIVNGRFVV